MAKPTKHKREQAPQTISLADLSTVTGGRTSATAAGQSSATAKSTSTDPNSQMITLLTEIADSLQSMTQGRSQNQDPFMRAIMLMQAMRGGGGGGPFGSGGGMGF